MTEPAAMEARRDGSGRGRAGASAALRAPAPGAGHPAPPQPAEPAERHLRGHRRRSCRCSPGGWCRCRAWTGPGTGRQSAQAADQDPADPDRPRLDHDQRRHRAGPDGADRRRGGRPGADAGRSRPPAGVASALAGPLRHDARRPPGHAGPSAGGRSTCCSRRTSAQPRRRPSTGCGINGQPLPGISMTPSYSRSYPNGRLAGSLIGFTNVDSSGDLAGEAGLEQEYNGLLAGRDGSEEVETGTDWRPHPETARQGHSARVRPEESGPHHQLQHPVRGRAGVPGRR